MLIQPLVSIVMPAYNAEKTIRDSIESVINQSYSNWQLIIIDDCSKDNTAKLIKGYLTDERIIIHQLQSNGGVTQARNKGIDLSKGKYIAFLDSDDLWHPDKLSFQLNFLIEHKDCDLHYTATSYIDNDNKSYAYRLQVPSELTYEDILKQNLIMCSSVVVKSEIIKEFPFIGNNEYHEDYATWLRILKQGYKACGSNIPFLIYRISRDSKSGNKKKAAIMQWKTYSLMEVPTMKKMMCFSAYALKNIIKYTRIFRS